MNYIQKIFNFSENINDDQEKMEKKYNPPISVSYFLKSKVLPNTTLKQYNLKYECTGKQGICSSMSEDSDSEIHKAS